MERTSAAIVKEYSLKASTGRHIRFATRVIFPSGHNMDFLEVMTRKSAIAQAQEALYREYCDYFMKSNPGQDVMTREHWLDMLERSLTA